MLSTAVLSMDYALGGNYAVSPDQVRQRGERSEIKKFRHISVLVLPKLLWTWFFDFHVSPKSLEQWGGNLCHCKPFPLRSIETISAFQRKILFSLLLLADSLKSTVDDAYT